MTNTSLRNPQEHLRRNIFLVKNALDWSVEYAISAGQKSETFTYVPKIWEDDAFLIVKDGEKSKNIAISGKTAQVFVPLSLIDNIHDLLHESIHRLGILQLSVRGNLLLPQIAETFDLQLVLKDNKNINPESFDLVLPSPGDYQTAKGRLVNVYERLLEGITEWATQFTNTISREHGYALFEDLSQKYSREVELIEKMKSDLSQKGMSHHHANGLLIAFALTGDAKPLHTKLSGDFLGFLNDL